MANIKIDGKVTKTKVATIRSSISEDEKYVGTEPVWDYDRALEMPTEEFDHHLRASLRYYNYFFTSKDLKKFVVEWAKERKDIDPAILAAFTKSSDGKCPLTACGLVRAHLKGMPLHDRHVEYLKETITRVANDHTDTDVVEEKAKPKANTVAVQPTIQDRLREIANGHINHFEELEEAMIRNKEFKLNAYAYCQAESVPQAMISKIAAPFEKALAELEEALEGKDEQLAEAYGHLSKTDIKRYRAFYTELATDLARYSQVKKAVKATRAKKPANKEKVVSKMKYQKENKVLKLVSIPPVTILGATQVWVFNTKTRKMFHYIADDLAGTLGVKGTSIVGYDTVKSVGKTLRKPEEQIAAFMKLGKVALRTFLKDIKAVEIAANGRINQDTILLKAI